MANKTLTVVNALAVGMGQVMLQNNRLTGALFLLGIGVNSLPMLVGAIVGLVASTLTAYLAKYDGKDITDGLYGFNGTLVGIAAIVFLPSQPATILLAAIGAALSTFVMRAFLRAGLRAYTAPFILVTWVMLIVASIILPPAAPASPASSLGIIGEVFAGLGQVMFQGSAISGCIFLIALLISSPRDAGAALIGSALGLLFGTVIGLPMDNFSCGLLGYNGALCAIALARTNVLCVLGAITVSVFLTAGFSFFGLTALTAPFVIATWIALGAQNLFRRANARTA